MPPLKFHTRLIALDLGRMKLQILSVPEKVAARLPAGRPRILLTIAGEALSRALGRSEAAGPHVIVGVAEVRRLGLRRGVDLPVSLDLDTRPTAVDLPPELSAALRADPAASRLWRALTPGRQRGLAYLVGRGRRPVTREKHAAAVIADLKFSASLPFEARTRRRQSGPGEQFG